LDPFYFGRRVAYWRAQRRMTQDEFARLMNRSRRWVQEVEAGRVQADPQLSVVQLTARRLGITLEQLLADDGGPGCLRQDELETVRTALHRHDVITGASDTSDTGPLPVSKLQRALVHARTGFQAGHFAQLGATIPVLLVDATRAAGRYQGDERLAAYRILSLVLELAEAAAIKWGDTELALLAGHHAVTAAERCGDPVIQASAARHLADAMTEHGQAAAAVGFLAAAVEHLQGELLASGPDGLSVLGMLHLKAAMASAAAAEHDDRAPAAAARAVPDHLAEADEHAARLGSDDNRLWTSFGPTNVSLYRVAAHVQLSQGSDAVTVAAGIPREARDRLPRERRAHLMADLARGQTQAGLRQEAVQTLLHAEALAPEEVRCRPRTKALIEDLRLLGAGSAEGRLRALADRCGLPR
jgi:transcriptional regulator with XRE-family HTH domain